MHGIPHYAGSVKKLNQVHQGILHYDSFMVMPRERK